MAIVSNLYLAAINYLLRAEMEYGAARIGVALTQLAAFVLLLWLLS